MKRWVFLGAALLAPASAWAGETPLYQPAPDWVTPAPAIDTAKIGDDAPIFLVADNQQRLQDGQVWAYHDNITRMSSTEVLGQAGTVTLPWQPDQGDLIVHKVEIIRGDQHIDVLAGGQKFTVLRREQQLEQRSMDGQLTATLAVPGLRVGDLLHVASSTTQKDPNLKGNVQAFAPLVSEPFKVRFARDRLLWPVGTDLHWKALAAGAKPVLTKTGGFNDLTIAMPLPKQVELPDDAPIRFKKLPLLEATSFDSWNAVSRTMAPLYATDGTIAPGSPLAAEVARIEKATTDPLQRTALALETVQDKIRYQFNGMQEGNYRPQTPAQTWDMRYGDCKAKTLMLLALLHAMRIEAEPVLANSKLGGLVPERLPTPGAFDHVLVRATVGGETLWLDGTDGGTELADIRDTPNFGYVLPLRAAGADPLRVDMRPNARPDVDLAYDLDQRAGIDLPAPFTIVIRFRGQVAQMLKVAKAQADKDTLDKMVAQATNKFTGDATLVSHTMTFDDASGTGTITATGIAYPDWPRQNERYKMTLDRTVSGTDFSPDRARQAWSDIPVAIGDAYRVHSVIRVKLPDAGQGYALDGDANLDDRLAGARIERTTKLADGTITSEETLVSTGGEIPVGDIAAARARMALAKSRLLKVVAPADTPNEWDQVAAAKKNGMLVPIAAAYKQVIADKSDDADPYLWRAWYLEKIYDRKAAIADVDHAIALSPDVGSYLRRSRLLKETGDKARALADAQAAHKLDPGNAEAVQALARLQYDTGHGDDALALLQERIDAGGDGKGSMLAVKADLLAKGGHKDEALAAIDQAVAANPGDPGLLNTRCWLKGLLNTALDTALKDCTKAIQLSDSPSSALDSRAMVYFRMNQMDDALGDLGAALENNPSAAGSLYLRGLIRERTGNKTVGATDIAAARTLSPLVDEEYTPYGIKP